VNQKPCKLGLHELLRMHLNPTEWHGMQGVRGSNPLTSTIQTPYFIRFFEFLKFQIRSPRPLVQQSLQQFFWGESDDTAKIKSRRLDLPTHVRRAVDGRRTRGLRLVGKASSKVRVVKEVHRSRQETQGLTPKDRRWATTQG